MSASEAARSTRIWKQAGADRYLLKIETSDPGLYRGLHPGMSFENRTRCLEDLAALGYQVGSGNLVGLKGQTVESLAGDLGFFKRGDFDMISVSPFIPHPQTPLAGEPAGDLEMTAEDDRLDADSLSRLPTFRPARRSVRCTAGMNGPGLWPPGPMW